MMRKNLAIAGLAAGLVGGGLAGFTLASPGGLAGASSLAAVQDDSGTSTATDAPSPGTWLSDTLQPLVDAGTITAEQRDAVVAALQAARPERGWPGGGPGHHGRPGLRAGLETAATTIGITAEELRTALQGGQTVAEVAAAHSVDAQTVIDAIVAQAKAKLDEKVAAGDLTQEEADTRLAEITERTTTFVNEGLPARGDRPASDSSTTDTSGATS